MKIGFCYDTCIGKISIIEEDNYIVSIAFGESLEKCKKEESHLIKRTYKELNQYFLGKRKKFDIPILLKGTAFQKKVWNELLKIQYGKTASYYDIAIGIGNNKAVRAVGMANHRNPIAIIVPCHRVIQKNGKIGGYGGGLNIKKKLFEIENIELS